MTVQAASAQLAKINSGLPDRFEAVVDVVKEMLTDESLDEWAELCVEMAETGWHGYETTFSYLQLTQPLLDAAGADRLLAAGRFGRDLCRYTFEPGKTYLDGYSISMDSGEAPVAVEKIGRVIHRRFAQASSLMTSYFQVAFHVARSRSTRDLEAWLDIAGLLAEKERGILLAFLEVSTTSETVPWVFAARLNHVATPGCVAYLEHYTALEQNCTPDLLIDLQPVIIKYVKGPYNVTPLYQALIRHQVATTQMATVVGLLNELDDVRLATCLVNSLSRLPLERPALVRQWFAEGIFTAQKSFEAGEAFFDIESARSLELLETLSGQVNFSDCKRIMRLYAEAFCGRRLAVESLSEARESDFRDLPATDGRAVYLPDSVSFFKSQAENFQYYKVALLHQLGFFEFGTFENLSRSRQVLQSFNNKPLAYLIFQLLGSARVDWQLEFKFRGIRSALKAQKNFALANRKTPSSSRKAQLLETVIRVSLDAAIPDWIDPAWQADATHLASLVLQLAERDATDDDVLKLVSLCYDLFDDDETEAQTIPDDLPEPVIYRGESDADQVMLNLSLLELEDELEITGDDEDMMSIATLLDPKNADIKELRDGDLQDMAGMLITEMDVDVEAQESDEETKQEFANKVRQAIKGISDQRRENQVYRYDEWDYLINDYRRRWCTLHEIRDIDEQPEFVEETLREYPHLARGVRKQLNMLKPELLRKIKGVIDGDELDLERAVEAIVDRKSGFTPDERIYVQRQRKDRDVAALFLLDMSASTDDVITDPNKPETEPDDDDFLIDLGTEIETSSEKRIIDLEKESVVLMSDALEELGDNYSVCGFSGYGRDQVEYFLCKDFTEPLDYKAKGRIGGIKPCRSTRMGPAIRHATRSLVRTECRIKALIIISDGYPQDFDYGKDRNSREYGIMDTMKALGESKQQGVQSFCLTVDPSGHDYLRSMCQDSEYMIIQDIKQLPNELSKVYRSLTG